MKKNYLITLIAVTCTFYTASAQFSDDFESYPLGYYHGGNWSSWTGEVGTQDIIVSDTYSFDGTKSGLIGGDQIQDVMLGLGNRTSGVYRLSFQMYIPIGKSGFMSFQGETIDNGGAGNGGSGTFNSLNLMFNNTLSESGAAGIGGAFVNPSNPSPVYSWEYPEATWFPIIIDFDVDNGVWIMTINGIELEPRYFGPNGVLGAMDFYSLTANNEVYIDAINFEDIMLSVNEKELNNFKAYPNPVKDYLNLSTTSVVELVEVFDILGHRILSIQPETLSPKLDFSELASGSYFVKASMGNQSKTLKIMKQ